MKVEKKDRLEYLDYLSGICAFVIMIYHYYIHFIELPNTQNILSRFGFYGVSIFYILSGIALTHVYLYKMDFNSKDILLFFKKRIFRIFPLMWLVIILQSFCLFLYYQKNPYSLYVYFINFTGLFGFIEPSGGIPNAAWSIGNELVFYTFFPFVVYLFRKNKILSSLFILATLLFYIYYAYYLFDNQDIYNDEIWDLYVNPFNQIFLFFGGMLIYIMFYKMSFPKLLIYFSLILGVLFYPADAQNRMELISGHGRIVFTISSFLFCFSMLKLNYPLPKLIHKFLKFFGEISYSVYLLYLLVQITLGKILLKMLPDTIFYKYIIIIALTVVTVFLSNYTYRFVEKKGIKLDNLTK
jgi:exopolysaccharide production protein ExoZ